MALFTLTSHLSNLLKPLLLLVEYVLGISRDEIGVDVALSLLRLEPFLWNSTLGIIL